MKISKKTSNKILSIALSLSFLFIFIINSYAIEPNFQYIYYYQDGTSVCYNLDSNGNAYFMNDGVKIFLALPLDQFKVSDESLIQCLNVELQNNSQSIQTYSVPSSYYDLSTGPADQNSISYNAYDLSFTNGEVHILRTLKFNPHHVVVRFKTNITSKATLAGSKVTFTYYYYNIYDDAWYNQRFEGKNCTSSVGFGVQSNFNVCPYGRFAIEKYSNIYTCNVSVWTTYAG